MVPQIQTGPSTTLQPLVVGARGFLGAAVAATLEGRGYAPRRITSGDLADVVVPTGMVFYCSGFAWGAEEHPAEAHEVHVEIPRRFLERGLASRFVYASSARIYAHSASTNESQSIEGEALGSSVYLRTKREGERVVLATSTEHRVVRLSSLIGASTRSELFVPDITRQAVTTGKVAIRTSLDSSKDYISVVDAADAMVAIALGSAHQVYNVAAGFNIEHRAWIEAIRREIPDLELEIATGSPTSIAPPIDVARLQTEFPFEPRDVIAEMPEVLRAFREVAGTELDPAQV